MDGSSGAFGAVGALHGSVSINQNLVCYFGWKLSSI